MAAIVTRAVAWQQLKGFWTRGWPTVQGTVESGTILTRQGQYGRYYIVQLAYSYAVNDSFYSGYYQKLFLREVSANSFVENLKDQMIFVRYKPDAPEKSALLKIDQPGGWPMRLRSY